jgi:hypothetical protein
MFKTTFLQGARPQFHCIALQLETQCVPWGRLLPPRSTKHLSCEVPINSLTLNAAILALGA